MKSAVMPTEDSSIEINGARGRTVSVLLWVGLCSGWRLVWSKV